MSDRFDKPLDTDLLETQEVEAPTITQSGELDQDGKSRFKIERQTEKVEIKTRYTRATPKFFTCATGAHHWVMIDKHRHIAACGKCQKRRFLRAVYEAITSDGHIVNRDSGTLLD